MTDETQLADLPELVLATFWRKQMEPMHRIMRPREHACLAD